MSKALKYIVITAPMILLDVIVIGSFVLALASGNGFLAFLVAAAVFWAWRKVRKKHKIARLEQSTKIDDEEELPLFPPTIYNARSLIYWYVWNYFKFK